MALCVYLSPIEERLSCVIVPIEEPSSLIDVAKLRRFPRPFTIFALFSFKNRLSVDVNQLAVCGHSMFVCWNAAL